MNTGKIAFAVLLLYSTLSLGQGLDKHEAFTSKKKSITLRTGIQLKYYEKGNPDGTPVLLLHGFTDSGRSFQGMIDELTRINKSLRIIAPDARGHGDSSMPSDPECAAQPEKCFTQEKLAADMLSLLDQLKIGKAHVVGHSMGSITAQYLATKHSQRVASLTLIGTFVNGQQSAGIQNFLIDEMLEGTWRPLLEKREGFQYPKDAYQLTAHGLGDDVNRFLRENWVNEACAEEKFLDAVFIETSYTHLGTWIGCIYGSLANVDTRDMIKTLKVPTLILWATQDISFPASDQKQVVLAFGEAAKNNGTKVLYKTYGRQELPENGFPLTEVGHNLHWGAPRQVAEDISSFIRTGYPEVNLPYANPQNVKEIIVDTANARIEQLGK